MVRFLSIIFDHILDFADNTAIHGPRYISEKSRPVIERLVISIVVVHIFLNMFLFEKGH